MCALLCKSNELKVGLCEECLRSVDSHILENPVTLPRPRLTVRAIRRRTCTCGPRVIAVGLGAVTSSVAPNALQASTYDEQLVCIGGEIALSGVH